MEAFLLKGKSIKEHLLKLTAYSNKPFTESLHPGVEHILGIRMGDLRKLAKQIAKEDWRSYIRSADTYYMEERTLHGLVLGYVPVDDIDEYLHYVDGFVKVINSWSVCDSFTFSGGSSFVSIHQQRLWELLKEYMNSSEEYEVRFGIVMALRYFIDETHLQELFGLLAAIRLEAYYVKMAIAWALSVCFVKYPVQTENFLKQCTLDDFTYRKTIQKIRESYRVSSQWKATLCKS